MAAFNKVGLLGHGQPDVGSLAAETCKCVGSNADDGGRLAVEMDDASDDGRISTEAALPEAIAQHHGQGQRPARILARGIEQAAQPSRRSQLSEVIRCAKEADAC
jgi:hypothetical protein